MNPDDLLGSWQLVDWVQHYDDGRIVRPFGEHPAGVITYVDGRMTCILSRAGRTPFSSDGQWTASDAEKARTYDEFMAYAGRYEFDGTTVIHHVEMSLFPGWIGGQQRRKAELSDGVLRLFARLEGGTAQARTAILKWRRDATDARPAPEAEH